MADRLFTETGRVDAGIYDHASEAARETARDAAKDPDSDAIFIATAETQQAERENEKYLAFIEPVNKKLDEINVSGKFGFSFKSDEAKAEFLKNAGVLRDVINGKLTKDDITSNQELVSSFVSAMAWMGIAHEKELIIQPDITQDGLMKMREQQPEVFQSLVDNTINYLGRFGISLPEDASENFKTRFVADISSGLRKTMVTNWASEARDNPDVANSDWFDIKVDPNQESDAQSSGYSYSITPKTNI